MCVSVCVYVCVYVCTNTSHPCPLSSLTTQTVRAKALMVSLEQPRAEQPSTPSDWPQLLEHEHRRLRTLLFHLLGGGGEAQADW